MVERWSRSISKCLPNHPYSSELPVSTSFQATPQETMQFQCLSFKLCTTPFCQTKTLHSCLLNLCHTSPRTCLHITAILHQGPVYILLPYFTKDLSTYYCHTSPKTCLHITAILHQGPVYILLPYFTKDLFTYYCHTSPRTCLHITAILHQAPVYILQPYFTKDLSTYYCHTSPRTCLHITAILHQGPVYILLLLVCDTSSLALPINTKVC